MARPFIPDGLVGLWFPGRGHPVQRRGTINDLSGKNNHGTIYGTPAVYFDGSGDQLDVGTRWDSLVGKRYAVLAGWLNVIDSAAIRYIYTETWAADNTKARVAIYVDATDYLVIGVRAGALTDTLRTSTSTSTIPQGTWHSFFMLIDLGTVPGGASTAVASVWIDGAVFAMGAFSATVTQGLFAASVPSVQRFGASAAGATNFYGHTQWLGFGGVTTPPTIVDAQRFHDFPQIWLAGSGLDAYWYGKEDTGATIDNAEGTAGRDLTLTGATWNSTIAGAHTGDARNAAGTPNSGDSFTGGYRFFDGDDDCLQIADAANLRFGTAPYQIHVWVAISATAADNAAICGKGDTAAGEWYLFLNIGVSSGKLVFYADNGAIGLTGGSSIKDGLLHLCSVLRNGNNVSLYLDTVQLATVSAAHNLNEATKPIQFMAADSVNPCKGNLYKAIIGTANKTIAQAALDMQAIYAQGPYR